MKLSLNVVLCSAVLSLPLAAQATGGMSSMSSSTPNLDGVRAALAKYKDPVAALGDGYLSTLVCMQFPASTEPGHMAMPAGGMGVPIPAAESVLCIKSLASVGRVASIWRGRRSPSTRPGHQHPLSAGRARPSDGQQSGGNVPFPRQRV